MSAGPAGSGAFNQSGGTNTGNLTLAYTAGTGIDSLSGTGQLSTTTEFDRLQFGGRAVFQQSGGTNTATSLTIGPSGRYRLSGGTLQITNGGMTSQGTFDGGGAAARPAHRLARLSTSRKERWLTRARCR